MPPVLALAIALATLTTYDVVFDKVYNTLHPTNTTDDGEDE